jgi:Holliday junction resolvase RusA-like endonuclease
LIEQTSKTLGPWRTAVAAAALVARQRYGTLTGPVFLTLTFSIRRPKRTANLYPSLDLDKLIRACGDALVHGQLLADDKQIVAISATKEWALAEPGCLVELAAIPGVGGRDTADPLRLRARAAGAPPPASVPGASPASPAAPARPSGTAR